MLQYADKQGIEHVCAISSIDQQFGVGDDGFEQVFVE